MTRNPTFAILKDADLTEFRKILDNSGDVVDSSDDLEKYNRDWTGRYCGSATIALRPRTTEQVSRLLKYCNRRRLAVCPQGGNTGLVGGAVPVFDEIVLSMERLNRLINHDEVSGVLSAEAGCILETADNFVRERGFVMPLDLGAKGSCMLGGNVATNAGGLRVLRYGGLHGSVLGLRVVLADGTVLDGMGACRKDNTGYDYKQLFIGSEGTLGVITEVNIATPPLPQSTNVALFSVAIFEDIKRLFGQARRDLGEILSAFEFWDVESQKLLDMHFPDNKLPIRPGAFFVLVETSGSDSEHDQSKLMRFLEDSEAQVVDGTMAQDETQLRRLWALRESIPEACAREGIVYKYDVSLPTARMYDPVLALRSRLAHPAISQIIGYGHFGDGNIHVNVATQHYEAAVVAQIEPYIYELVRKHGGSISAEHGVGVLKAPQMGRFAKTAAEMALLRNIKTLFDPRGILNPYKVLP
ncbi:putative D-lactate dehydrogenase (Cytochrome) [Paramicrosporidium saccamoebae]|uniref:Putative D-lactate dehydrogenase (Cytochrome) n=1 Tax=Paramicrosporidium saccamoebae TaxID=1246581 RepID=A0A2H9THY1_9FUNG|nr:putative D-lactate dehydrogenase (Cytochrome) [Paramicrosporidium saccamoebae]